MKLYIFILLIGVSLNTQSQSIWTVSDPSGIEVFLNKDSSYLKEVNGLLLFYTMDINTDKRNILVTDGTTSSWLFADGFSKDASFTRFINRYAEELVFGIDGVWYVTEGAPESTEVFYDNHDADNDYNYLKIFQFSSINIDGFNLAIEAEVKSTGDTVILYYNTELAMTTEYEKKLRILEDNLPNYGPFEGSFYIGSEYDDVKGEWSEVGFYREYISTTKNLLSLGIKNEYKTNSISGVRLVDHQEDETKLVYQYDSDLDSFTDITLSQFPGYTVLDLQSLKWTEYGFPLQPQVSYKDYYFKGKNSFGQIRYFTTDRFGALYEIEALRNVTNLDFIHSDFSPDSIYYYNYNEQNSGLIRYDLYNKGTTKDPTSIQFDSEYKLKGYIGRLYHGKYNPESGNIEASVIDFPNDGEIYYLESLDDKRIESPVDFTFLENKVFVHSRINDGLKLVVYDPDGVVAIEPDLTTLAKVSVAPNPSFGLFKIRLETDYRQNINYVVIDNKGAMVLMGDFVEPYLEIDLTSKPSGSYMINFFSNGKVVSSKTIVVLQ